MDLPENIMRGKTALITGATGGIGKEAARGLARLGAEVIIVGRDEQRGQAALEELRATTGGRVHLLLADLSVQAEVHRLAEQVQDQFARLDVLVNNVAGIFRQRTETADGIEATFALGHLAPFLLTHLLQPMLIDSQPARIINLVSDGHTMGKLDFDDLQARQSYRGLDMYLRVKLANVLFTYELARRLAGSGVTVNAAEPGAARTQLIENTTSDMLPPAMRLIFPLIKRFGMSSIEHAARSSIYAAAAPELASVSGKYFNAKLKEGKSSKASYDIETARRLWRVSEDLVGISADQKIAV